MSRQDDNHHLEAALRGTLARRPGPAGLAGRVMAKIRTEVLQKAAPADTVRWWDLRPRLTLRWAMAGACVALLWVMLYLPPWQDARPSNATAAREPDVELAEALQLAGSKWNRVREAAFPSKETSDND